MKREDLAFGDLIGVLEEDFAVNSSGSDQSWVESFDLIRSHDDFDITAVVETIKLVKKFEHSTLNFTFSAGSGLVSLCTDGINLINEDDRRGIFGSNLVNVSLLRFATLGEEILLGRVGGQVEGHLPNTSG